MREPFFVGVNVQCVTTITIIEEEKFLVKQSGKTNRQVDDSLLPFFTCWLFYISIFGV